MYSIQTKIIWKLFPMPIKLSKWFLKMFLVRIHVHFFQEWLLRYLETVLWKLKFIINYKISLLISSQIYNETDLQRTKLDLLSSTNMVDFAMDIQASLYPDQPVSTELTDKRTKVVAELKRLQVSFKRSMNCFVCIVKDVGL